MDIAQRDTIIQKLNEQLQVLTNYKMERMRELQEKVNDNKLLEKVVDDYKLHNQKIIDMKRQQSQQIEYLLLYLEKSMAEAGVTENMLKQAKHQKNELTRQIKSIHDEINSLL